MEAKCHFIEIDLLRDGTHTTAVPIHRMQRVVPAFDYHVCVHRYDNFEDFYVYPIGLRNPLPTIKIPLLPGDGEVSVSLQQVFTRTYEAGPYQREIDYQQAVPSPKLADEKEQWVRSQLATANKNSET